MPYGMHHRNKHCKDNFSLRQGLGFRLQESLEKLDLDAKGAVRTLSLKMLRPLQSPCAWNSHNRGPKLRQAGDGDGRGSGNANQSQNTDDPANLGPDTRRPAAKCRLGGGLSSSMAVALAPSPFRGQWSACST